MGKLTTPLCTALGIEHPILSVGFGDAARPALVTAVSEAGALGVLGGSVPVTELRTRIRRVRDATARPFGVNVIIAALDHPEATDEDRDDVRERIAAIIEENVPVLVLFWGEAAPFVEPAHQHGVKVLVQVGTVEEARAAADAGVDAVIAQGLEAGGHVRATMSIWEFLPRVVERLGSLPVLASGGIGDGAQVARALHAGAQGVSLGTRFVASAEAWVPDLYKQRVAASRSEDTFYGELFDVGWEGAPHRALKNKTFLEWDAAGRPPSGRRPGEGGVIGRSRPDWGEEQTWRRYESRMLTPDFEGDIEYAPMWAGESVGAIDDIKPAAQIVQELVDEAQRVLQ